MSNNRLTIFSTLFFLTMAFLLAACSTAMNMPVLAVNPEPVEQVNEDLASATTYKSFTLPMGISFELPDNWDFWANAGYLSPDDGRTLAGVRVTWMD